MFGGTFAAKGGIRPADRFEFELEDPVLKRKISHGYDVITMPVLGCKCPRCALTAVIAGALARSNPCYPRAETWIASLRSQ